MDKLTMVIDGQKINVDVANGYAYIEITAEETDDITSIALNCSQAQIIAWALMDMSEQVE
jgi:hypothetical protein